MLIYYVFKGSYMIFLKFEWVPTETFVGKELPCCKC